EGVRAGGAGVGGQRMHTARACDGGWTQSGGGRGVLACLPGLGFFFSICYSSSSSMLCPYIFSSSLLYSISTTSSSCRPPSLLHVYVCSIAAPLMAVSTLALRARYI
ncbi:hypothetical protein B0H13DRAFT_1982647, partial [Mycena leptocephala]